jgi:molybdopterin biosynthesis enzyme
MCSSPGAAVERPQELGLLAALGMDRVSVARRPKVAIIFTGMKSFPWISLSNQARFGT